MSKTLTAEQANDLRFYDEVDNWKVVDRASDGEGRWYSFHSAIVTDDDGLSYWLFQYDLPLTECQELENFIFGVELKTKMVPEEVVKVVYKEYRG